MPQPLKSKLKELNDKYKDDPFWTYSSELTEDLVAKNRGLSPSQWKNEPKWSKIKMIATYRSERKMDSYRQFYFTPKDTLN